MAAKADNQKESGWFLSDWFLGVLVAILSAATAFSAFQSALTGLEGYDLDTHDQKTLILAITSFLTANTEFLVDIQTYDSHKLLAEQNLE